MKTKLCFCAAFLATCFSLHAEQSIGFPKDKPVLTFSLPDKWEVKHEEDLIATPPEEDSVIVEVTKLEAPLADAEAAVKEAKETMEDFKNVKYDEAQKGEKDGLGVTIFNATGEDEDGKAFINLVLITKEGEKNFILLSCISSKEGSDKHGAEISALIQSLKAK